MVHLWIEFTVAFDSQLKDLYNSNSKIYQVYFKRFSRYVQQGVLDRDRIKCFSEPFLDS